METLMFLKTAIPIIESSDGELSMSSSCLKTLVNYMVKS